MIRKKLILFIIAMMVAFLAACGNGGESTSGEEEDGKTTLKFYTWINEENGNWEETIKAFEEAHPDIKIDLKVLVENMSSDDYLQKLDLDAAAGEKIDVLMTSSSEHLSKRVSAGMIEPIDTYLENEGINVEEVYNMAASSASSDGSYYGLPSKYNTYLIMLNKNHLDDAGLEVPTEWTWEEYKDYANELTTNDRYGSYLHTWSTFYHVLKVLGKADENLLIKADGSSNMDDPTIAESLKLRYELEQEDKSSEPYANIISQQLNYRQQFFSEQASMTPISSYMVTEWGGFNPEFPIAWAPWPKNNEGDPSYAFSSADVMSIGNNSDHKEEAYEFIRWMTTEGMLVQNKSIPAWTETDLKEVLTNLASTTSNPDAVDVESLQYTIENSVPTEQFLPAGYMTEVYNAYNAEAERYLLGEQDLDTTMENAKNSVEDVIDANK
ncbi:ABC transporter substrate-binding protein [Oceanobacillus longus]|uniref:ABC transporter substrate-binding protein n=1 Tax=Oceanobacillus longus TaxID=930120 RepID=A0ABV8H1K3_9BACI